jgi:glycosyltransferase involved in cell wall biosynthesis
VLSLQPGGAERLVIDLCRRTREEFANDVCCLDEPGAWAATLPDDVRIVTLGRRPGFQPSLALRIAQTAARLNATVLHCHQYSPFVYGALAKLVPPYLPVVATEHGRLNNGRATLKRQIANRLMNLMSIETFAVSASLREQLISEGFPERRVGVIHNGIDPGAPASADARQRARTAFGFASDDFVVGGVGRLDPVKDYATLIDAFGLLSRLGRRIRLILIGDGPQRVDLTRRLRDCGLSNVASLLGHRDDVRDLLPAMDVFVSSSIFEGVSLTLLEAMAAGLPVVATRVGGTPEVVVDQVTGLLVPPRAPEALASAVARLMADPEDRAAQGASGRARVVQSFHIDTMVHRYMEIYRRLGAA